jgi:general secretion pathway protein D
MTRNFLAIIAGAFAVSLVLSSSSAAAEKATATQKGAAVQPSLQEKLNQRGDIDIVEMPLKDVCLMLNREFGIQALLQLKKLEEASVSADTPITKSFKQVRLSTILELLLKDLELTYVEKDGLLLITTPEDAESRLQIRLYDCRDLLAMPAPQVPSPPGDRRAAPAVPPQSTGDGVPAGTRQLGGSIGGDINATPRRRIPETELEKRTDQLTDLITSSVQPDSWDEVGGPGSIVSYNGLYVVAQTTRAQDQVEQLLNLLREAAGLDLRAGKAVRD